MQMLSSDMLLILFVQCIQYGTAIVIPESNDGMNNVLTLLGPEGQTTTPGTPYPTFHEYCVGS